MRTRVATGSRKSPIGQLTRLFLLAALGVDALVEVAAAMQQGHRDERHLEIGGGPERVARQHAEPARVGRDLGLESDLHREVRDEGLAHVQRAVGRMPSR